MFQRSYLRAAFLAAALGAAAELARQLAHNVPVLRPPLAITLTALALVAGSFTMAAFWVFAAVFRVAPRARRSEAATPIAPLVAALAAPQICLGTYFLLPYAKLSWLAALGFGLVFGPIAGAAAAWMLKRRVATLALAASCALALASFAARFVWAGVLAPRDPRPNFVLVTLDTTRADHLGCYGYAAARTPTLDGLAARGVKFHRVVCAEPLTGPSHASVMTSLYPRTTGVTWNAMKLRPDAPTLAELFRAAGYRTAAFVSAAVVQARNSAFNRGFEVYDDAVKPAEGYRSTPVVPRPLARKFALLASDDNLAERPASAVTAAAEDWLRRRDRRAPLFLWLHYYDPHNDYLPPETFVPPAFGGRPYYRLMNKRWAADKEKNDPPLAANIRALYDGEIAFVDRQLGLFLAAMRRYESSRPTVIIVIGDHGESFGEHGVKYHGHRLYRDEMEVPFIISRTAGRLPPPSRRWGVISLLDVAPTILDLAGLPVPAEMRGRALFMAGVRPSPSAYCTLTPQPLRASKYSIGPMEALTTPTDKIIVHGGGAVEYYDLRYDPGEINNGAAAAPERVAALRAELDARRAAIPDAPSYIRASDGAMLAPPPPTRGYAK